MNQFVVALTHCTFDCVSVARAESGSHIGGVRQLVGMSTAERAAKMAAYAMAEPDDSDADADDDSRPSDAHDSPPPPPPPAAASSTITEPIAAPAAVALISPTMTGSLIVTLTTPNVVAPPIAAAPPLPEPMPEPVPEAVPKPVPQPDASLSPTPLTVPSPRVSEPPATAAIASPPPVVVPPPPTAVVPVIPAVSAPATVAAPPVTPAPATRTAKPITSAASKRTRGASASARKPTARAVPRTPLTPSAQTAAAPAAVSVVRTKPSSKRTPAAASRVVRSTATPAPIPTAVALPRPSPSAFRTPQPQPPPPPLPAPVVLASASPMSSLSPSRRSGAAAAIGWGTPPGATTHRVAVTTDLSHIWKSPAPATAQQPTAVSGGGIKVFVRFRPFPVDLGARAVSTVAGSAPAAAAPKSTPLSAARSRQLLDCVTIGSADRSGSAGLRDLTIHDLHAYGDSKVGIDYRFAFDDAFSAGTTQRTVFDRVARPVIDRVFRSSLHAASRMRHSAASPSHGTIIAFGQTGTGKTHSMFGAAALPRVDSADSFRRFAVSALQRCGQLTGAEVRSECYKLDALQFTTLPQLANALNARGGPIHLQLNTRSIAALAAAVNRYRLESESIDSSAADSSFGVIPRAIDAIFQLISTHQPHTAVSGAAAAEEKASALAVSVSYFECYRGRFRDLLALSARASGTTAGTAADTEWIDPKQSLSGECVLPGLSHRTIHSFAQLQPLLADASPLRTVSASDDQHTASSRAHTFFDVSLTRRSDGVNCGVLRFVDLAGTEQQTATDSNDSRSAVTAASAALAAAALNSPKSFASPLASRHRRKSTSAIAASVGNSGGGGSSASVDPDNAITRRRAELDRRMECKSINTSLSAFSKCIKELAASTAVDATATVPTSSPQPHIPFRECSLTRVLQSSLCGNSGGSTETAILLTCSLDAADVKRTLNTLRFGASAITVRLQPPTQPPLTPSAQPTAAVAASASGDDSAIADRIIREKDAEIKRLSAQLASAQQPRSAPPAAERKSASAFRPTADYSIDSVTASRPVQFTDPARAIDRLSPVPATAPQSTATRRPALTVTADWDGLAAICDALSHPTKSRAYDPVASLQQFMTSLGSIQAGDLHRVRATTERFHALTHQISAMRADIATAMRPPPPLPAVASMHGTFQSTLLSTKS